MWKHILVLGLILTTLGGYVFWSSHRKHKTRHDASKNVPAQVATQQVDTATREKTQGVPPSVSKAERVSQTLHAYYGDVGDLGGADPEFKKMLEIFASPEFATFVEESGEYTTDAYYGFLASQGIPWDRDAYYMEIAADFQKHFPGETPESMEPQIREKLINIFQGEYTTVTEMLTEFLDEKTLAWMSARFPNSYREFGDWVAGQIRDHFHSTTPGTPAPLETPPSVLPADAAATDAHSVEDVPKAPPDTPTESTAPPLPENNGRTPEDFDIETEIQKLLESTLPETPKMPTIVDIEKEPRNRFSPQRYNTALQTLNRYGPEEGLRRLQKSDPEVATHLEQLLQRRQEND